MNKLLISVLSSAIIFTITANTYAESITTVTTTTTTIKKTPTKVVKHKRHSHHKKSYYPPQTYCCASGCTEYCYTCETVYSYRSSHNSARIELCQ